VTEKTKARRKKQKPTDPWTLQEAVFWIATGDPTPRTIPHYVDFEEEQAERALYRGLRGGILKGFGRASERYGAAAVPQARIEIPAEHWNPCEIFWSSSTLFHSQFEYRDVVISRSELVRKRNELETAWPREWDSPTEQGRRGRKPEYDRESFLRLAFWHFVERGVPANQAEVVKELGPILDLAWEGSSTTPSETWLKEHAKKLFQARETYQKIKRRLSLDD
jgi:hypothetical protein